ncbi:hypothetical protein C8J57DRAFT_1277502 [Mycena rebaudengoi]|nr:hypothetical protein C8J57DRAFT_1277502 [Mycena rebaudengoi]
MAQVAVLVRMPAMDAETPPDEDDALCTPPDLHIGVARPCGVYCERGRCGGCEVGGRLPSSRVRFRPCVSLGAGSTPLPRSALDPSAPTPKSAVFILAQISVPNDSLPPLCCTCASCQRLSGPGSTPMHPHRLVVSATPTSCLSIRVSPYPYSRVFLPDCILASTSVCAICHRSCARCGARSPDTFLRHGGLAITRAVSSPCAAGAVSHPLTTPSWIVIIARSSPPFYGELD